MSRRTLEINHRKVSVLEDGAGEPTLYLHGFADVHAVTEGWMAFHMKLAERCRLFAPAHPGCATSDEIEYLESAEDLVFHYLEVIDALGLDHFNLVGSCVGGWLAAELAVRHPDKVQRLVLIDASGLFVPGAPIGDIFMMSHPVRGTDYSELRAMLFETDQTIAGRTLFPDGRAENLEDELRRYQMLRFTNRFGFNPPYFYNRSLRSRLHRIAAPTLVLWGESDHMVPLAHGEAYASAIPNSTKVTLVSGTGHSPQVEDPQGTAALVMDFLENCAVPV